MNYECVNSLDTICYNFDNILNFSDDDIIKHVETFYISYKSLVSNFDRFLHIVFVLMCDGYNVINVPSYECVKFINKHLKDRLDIVVNVLDDYTNKDRSYINACAIDKIKFVIPISYLMWNVEFQKSINVYTTEYSFNALAYNGNTTVKADTLKRIKDLIMSLKGSGKYSDLEIIILVSNYLQSKVEYIDETSMLVKSNPNIENEIGLIETVLFKSYGLCMGIANSTSVLLNNPEFNIDARTITTRNHAFNLVRLNGIYYYVDNTWNITMSPKQMKNLCRTSEFNSRFLLYGSKTLEYNGLFNIASSNPNLGLVPIKNFRQDEIIKAQKRLSLTNSFKYK